MVGVDEPGKQPAYEDDPQVFLSSIRHLPYRRRKLTNPKFSFASGLKLRAKYSRSTYQFGKRVIDVAISLTVLVLLSPLLLLIMLGIVLSDGWPVVFAQRRVGQNGQVFRIFKFRSMVKNAEAVLAARPDLMEEYKRTFKIANDPRIFPLGRFMRKTSLDELPQLWNVVRGEMSLVGPRPIVEKELEMYGDQKDIYLAMKPGCAGLWQCSGRSDTTYDERVLLDEQYYRGASLRNDIKILAMTFLAIFRREGAH
ncbi:sugar transferase [bacterium]|nr:MAG: sugar transferase [bacterium]